MNIDYNELCRELYDPQKSGVVVFPAIFNDAEAEGVLTELKENSRNFVERPRQYGTTDQELSSWDFEHRLMLNYPYMSFVYQRYRVMSKRIHEALPYAHIVNELQVNATRYGAGSIGIGPHRDNTFSVNFVLVYVFSGDGDFCTAKNKEGVGEEVHAVSPGDAILMRGPRSDEERCMRPVHYVKGISRERYTIVFREINHELLRSLHEKSRLNA